MNNSFDNYEDKLDSILLNIKNKNKEIKNEITDNFEMIDNIKNETISDIENNTTEKNETNETNKTNETNETNTTEKNTTEKNIDKPVEKDYYCKQLDSLNYCLEMHKVRKNKKADFDIHSSQKYSIEDEDIDKPNIVLGWKDLSDIKKEKLIEDFIVELTYKHNLEIKETMDFVNLNIGKIKYDKQSEKIIDILGMTTCIENNTKVLKIKQKMTKTNSSNINKLRKSLLTSKKSKIA